MNDNLFRALDKIKGKYTTYSSEVENSEGMIDVSTACSLANTTPYLIENIERLSKEVQELKKKNKKYQKAVDDILTEECGSEGLDAERELDRVTDIKVETQRTGGIKMEQAEQFEDIKLRVENTSDSFLYIPKEHVEYLIVLVEQKDEQVKELDSELSKATEDNIDYEKLGKILNSNEKPNKRLLKLLEDFYEEDKNE